MYISEANKKKTDGTELVRSTISLLVYVEIRFSQRNSQPHPDRRGIRVIYDNVSSQDRISVGMVATGLID